jgi:hypothetical protein
MNGAMGGAEMEVLTTMLCGSTAVIETGRRDNHASL